MIYRWACVRIYMPAGSDLLVLPERAIPKA